MILMEMRFFRDALDHILDAVQPNLWILAARDIPKVRTISQLRPASPLRARAYIIEAPRLTIFKKGCP